MEPAPTANPDREETESLGSDENQEGKDYEHAILIEDSNTGEVKAAIAEEHQQSQTLASRNARCSPPPPTHHVTARLREKQDARREFESRASRKGRRL